MAKFFGSFIASIIGAIPALLIFRHIGWSFNQVVTVYKVFIVSGLIWAAVLTVFVVLFALVAATSR